LADTAHEYERSFGPDGASSTHFGIPNNHGASAVAVDPQSHDIYVADLDLGAIYKFDENANPLNFTAGPGAGTNKIEGFSFLALEGFTEIAVSPVSHDFYVAEGHNSIKAFHANGEAAEFTSGPSAGGNEITSFEGDPFGEVGGVAVDANGDIYVSHYTAGAVYVYGSTGEELSSFSAGEPANVAVDSHGAVYVSHYEGEVEKFAPTEFPVTASTEYPTGVKVDLAIDPETAYAISLDPATDDLYVVEHIDLEHSQVEQLDEEGNPLSVFAAAGEPGHPEYSEGIAINGETGDVYVSDARGQQQVEVFTPPPPVPPTVESTTVTKVSTSSANFRAQINPNLFQTHYHFEYLSEAKYLENGETFAGAFNTPEVSLGSSGEAQLASGFAGGLSPDTAYRFRVVAENEGGEATTPEPAPGFSTYPALPPGLPDGRAYEMVSPPQKAGEVMPPDSEGNLDGSCGECLPGIANRHIMPMQSSADGQSVAYMGQPFASGLSSGPNEYLAHRTPGGWESRSLSSALFNPGPLQGYAAFSSDLSRSVIFQVEPALSPAAPTREGKSFANLYLRDMAGTLVPLVAAEPPHRDPGPYVAGSPKLANGFNTVFGGANSGTPGSPAFTHVVFEANDALTAADPPNAPAAPAVAATENDLYEWEGGQLRLVNVLPGNASSAPNAVIGSGLQQVLVPGIETAGVDHAISADGNRIFWSDPGGQVYVRIGGVETRKVEDPGNFLVASTDGARVLLSDGCLYGVAEEECEADLTSGLGGFQGILGASDDLSRAYFVDTKILPGAAANAHGESPGEGMLNLYAWSQQTGTSVFIARLLSTDNEIGSLKRYGDWRASSANRTAQVSPDGTHLAFMSAAPLTGYDNEQEEGFLTSCDLNNGPGAGNACLEVFAYDADTNDLSCSSCNPTGLRPLGQSNLSLITVTEGLPSFLQPGNLSADGRLFFESQDILSPRDNNSAVQDVYEWVPNGVGGCKRDAGCVSLISTGTSESDSIFLDATPSGNDAFLITREQIAAADRNDQLDLYDARVGGGIAAETETLRSECQGEACQPAALVPSDPTPSSSVFHGAGNVKQARAKKHKSKKKRKRHANKRGHRRAAHNDRGGAK
jgi:hypothetical protein